MDSLYEMSLKVHVGFIFLTLLVATFHVAMLFAKTEFKNIAKKIHWWIPAYYFLISTILFSGIIAWVSIEFHLTHWVAIMLLTWALMLASSIASYSKFKKTKNLKDSLAIKNFKNFALIKYLFDIVLILIIYFGAS